MVSKSEEIAVLVACHTKIASQLYAQAFTRCFGVRVAALTTSIGETLQAVSTNEIQLALISSTLKDGPLSGFLALQKMHEACPGVKSVVLLEADEDHLVTAAFCAGARGVFSPANESLKSLCRCVRQVSKGQIWANSSQLEKVIQALMRRAPVQVVNADGARMLTKREEEVVQLVADGLTNREIAKDLQLSEHTVKNNLFRIFDKLGVSTRVELALYAVNHSKLAPIEVSFKRKEPASVAEPLQQLAAS